MSRISSQDTTVAVVHKGELKYWNEKKIEEILMYHLLRSYHFKHNPSKESKNSGMKIQKIKEFL